MNGISMNGSSAPANNGTSMDNGNGTGFLGGMDLSTISALVVLAGWFMRR